MRSLAFPLRCRQRDEEAKELATCTEQALHRLEKSSMSRSREECQHDEQVGLQLLGACCCIHNGYLEIYLEDRSPSDVHRAEHRESVISSRIRP